MIVSGEHVARFVSEKLGFGLCPPYAAIGMERNGQIEAGVIFHCFEGASVHVTAAGTGWTRGLLREIGHYAFDQLGCVRMTLTTEREDVARLGERLGGKREGILRSQFGEGRDGILLGILREEYRHGNVRPS